ncbi:uncharacterized protein LOC121248560 [Juglans microcarpa x Juglans regia]|uniref:uncharacterized protein LOC121248560 n=1 Tax=Juglans microcarpa x Juglans regia TaxID=2249226 RepID=UPI001B7E8072|nr:uncharacterized protein LOC121248560 [Juglans microcarpa x Juglans regia]
MEEFNVWVGSYGLLDMPFHGNSLSWCNVHSGRSRNWARLDRCFFNTTALDAFPDANMEYLARTFSDHAPMTFKQMWVSHAQFFDCVSYSWNGDAVGGSPLEDRIKGLEASLQSEYTEDVEDDLVASQLELLVWLDREEKRLTQQAKQGWIQKGEANSVFFRAISHRNHKETKEMKLEDGYYSLLTKADSRRGNFLFFSILGGWQLPQ